MDLEQKVNYLQIEIAALKEKVGFFSLIFEKLDTTIGKIENIIEERRSNTDDDLKDVYNKINSVESNLLLEIKHIKEKMEFYHNEGRKTSLEFDRWRWLIIGASAVIGWIISKVKIPFE